MQEVGCVVQLHVRASLRRCKALKQQNSYSPWNFLSRINEPVYTQNMCGLLGGGRYIDTSVRSEPGISFFFEVKPWMLIFSRCILYVYIYAKSIISTNVHKNTNDQHKYGGWRTYSEKPGCQSYVWHLPCLMMQFQKIVSIDCLNINLKCGS